MSRRQGKSITGRKEGNGISHEGKYQRKGHVWKKEKED